MKLLSVGLTGTTDEIRARLQQDCITLMQEGFRIGIDEINKGNYTFLGCNVTEGELSFRNYERIKGLLKNYVAQILTELIMSREEKIIVRKIIDHNYDYFSQIERNIIYDNTLSILNGNAGILGEFGHNDRRGSILEKIKEYLGTHHELVLEGFINFRLKDYKQRLVGIVDSAVDDYILEMEYKEFVQVLRYFVDMQKPQLEEVHVILGDGGSFTIMETNGKVINNQAIENFIMDDADEINCEDLLITALITIAPYNIMIHCRQPAMQNAVDTIKNIFDGRVALCEGCQMCGIK